MSINKESAQVKHRVSKSKPGRGDEIEVNSSRNTSTSHSTLSNQNANTASTSNAVKCSRAGCIKSAVRHPDWEGDFCSKDCALLRCREVFLQASKSSNLKQSR